jgi:arylsulfatase A-like enzyme
MAGVTALAKPRPGPGSGANLLTQMLPPNRLTKSSNETPCCIPHESSCLTSTGSGRVRDASSARSGHPGATQQINDVLPAELFRSHGYHQLLPRPDVAAAQVSGRWRPFRPSLRELLNLSLIRHRFVHEARTCGPDLDHAAHEPMSSRHKLEVPGGRRNREQRPSRRPPAARARPGTCGRPHV